jgi:hypothetical protein
MDSSDSIDNSIIRQLMLHKVVYKEMTTLSDMVRVEQSNHVRGRPLILALLVKYCTLNADGLKEKDVISLTFV